MQSGLSCLHVACQASSPEVVEFLIEAGGKELLLKQTVQEVSAVTKHKQHVIFYIQFEQF